MLQLNIPESEAYALTLLTYIGCGISLVCLAASILFFISYGYNVLMLIHYTTMLTVFHSKTLLTSVHYFVHLNLAVALFLGYAVFLVGTYYEMQHRVSCCRY